MDGNYFICMMLIVVITIECGFVQYKQNIFPKTVPQILNIHFTFDFNYEVNTFDLTIKKNLGNKEIVTVHFYFTKSEQDRILSALQSIKFFSLPDTLDQWHIVRQDPDPGSRLLRIRFRDKDKTIIWHYNLDPYDKTMRSFDRFRSTLESIIRSNPIFKTMPTSKILYQ